MKNKVALLLAISIFLSFSIIEGAGDFTSRDSESLSLVDFNLPDIEQNMVSLSSYRGKEPVLLFFWTSWCPYCRKELNILNKKYAQLTKEGMGLLAINVGEASYRVENFIKKYQLDYKVLLDVDGKTIDAFGLLGVPTYILIDKKGAQRLKSHSFPENDYKALLSE